MKKGEKLKNTGIILGFITIAIVLNAGVFFTGGFLKDIGSAEIDGEIEGADGQEEFFSIGVFRGLSNFFSEKGKLWSEDFEVGLTAGGNFQPEISGVENKIYVCENTR